MSTLKKMLSLTLLAVSMLYKLAMLLWAVNNPISSNYFLSSSNRLICMSGASQYGGGLYYTRRCQGTPEVGLLFPSNRPASTP